ncbi:Kynurenine--oxoglutarate transaminase [Camellia lanceoleosa]|uniref:Kynurenine--oxoglutarate transaminase n=1 Tax=Camellia lanceoleosa TaxID=1840588 RepID=A0ACC0G0X3_9ERIC|nr:Kynurenine--oxoglutarate transaminase [Camellia lanceoleosa]
MVLVSVCSGVGFKPYSSLAVCAWFKELFLIGVCGVSSMCLFHGAIYQGVSLSGWRIGWAVAPAYIASTIRNIHTKLTDSTPAPFQEGALTALRSPLEYFESLRRVGFRKL